MKRRNHRFAPLLLVSALALAGCRKSSPAATEPVPSTSANTPKTSELEAAAASFAAAPGPASSKDPAARKDAVFALLAGQVDTDTIPDVATEPGEELDMGLRDRLAPVEKERAFPPGNVTVGTPETTGSIQNAPRVVAAMRSGFRNCYRRMLVGNPGAAGSIHLRLDIDGDGAVQDASVTPSGALPPALSACVRARASAAHFAAPQGTDTATIAFRVTFTPE